jgi:hypothetical protein
MSDELSEARKKERSPSFPFISLPKAVERARSVYEKYRREPARVTVVGGVWGLGPKSSGLLQTVAALKQYGLMEDSGSREDRKVTLTPLALRILIDTRPGQREDGLREAALKPRLFADYRRWAQHRPPDDHCISELQFEKGFTQDAAKTFIRVFGDTVQFAGVGDSDDMEVAEDDTAESALQAVEAGPSNSPARESTQEVMRASAAPALNTAGPLSERLKVELTVGALRITAVVRTPSEADTLIQFIQANKILLESGDGAT